MFQLSEESLSVCWQILAQDHVVLSSVVFTGKKLPLTTLFQSLIKVGVPESAFYANSVFTAVERTHQTKKRDRKQFTDVIKRVHCGDVVWLAFPVRV